MAKAKTLRWNTYCVVLTGRNGFCLAHDQPLEMRPFRNEIKLKHQLSCAEHKACSRVAAKSH
jgi:hypothetical protein